MKILLNYVYYNHVCCTEIAVSYCTVLGVKMNARKEYKKLSYRLQNRASTWCIRLIIMLLSGICFFLQNLVKPTMKTYFNIKWYFKVTQGQLF